MPTNTYGFATTSTALTCLLLLCAIVHPTLAQKPDPLSAAFQQKIEVQFTGASMDAMISAICSSSKLSVVADSEPRLQKADMTMQGTVREALDEVSDKFDYMWTVSKNGVVMMSKRFKDPKERPQVNLPELLEMTRNMIRALNTVDYDKDPSHWQEEVKGLAQTFTPQQTLMLDLGAKLKGSDLLPQQRQHLERAILSNAFASTLQMWEGLLPKIENMPVSRLQARSHKDATPGTNTPQYDYLYIYQRANGQPHVSELPHMSHGLGNERTTTP